MDSIKILIGIVELIAMLACAGTLIDTTRDLKKEAIKLHQRGLMELGPWSRQIEGLSQKRLGKN